MKSALTYAPTASGDVAVYIEQRRVGTIRKIGKGFAYFPGEYRRGTRGEILPSVADVLASLEGEP